MTSNGRREGCRDFNGPFPQSLWMSAMAPDPGSGAFFHLTTPDMRWPLVLFKTVTEGADG